MEEMKLATVKFLNTALGLYGLMEVKGKADHPAIIGFFNEIGYKGNWVKDEVSWCSAFVNHCAKAAGLPYTSDLSARSWLNVGTATDSPQVGDVVVFWRGEHKEELIPESNVKKGHVAIYINEDENYYFVLGGNQSNMVCITAYPKHKVVGIRRLES